MSPLPAVPDEMVIVALMLESIQLGHRNPQEGLEWAEENGYIEMFVDDDGEDAFRVLDGGRRHVGAKVVVPEWN